MPMAVALVYEIRRHAGSLRAPALQSVGVGGVVALVERPVRAGVPDAGVAEIRNPRRAQAARNRLSRNACISKHFAPSQHM
jgi:hypothetical protein